MILDFLFMWKCGALPSNKEPVLLKTQAYYKSMAYKPAQVIGFATFLLKKRNNLI